MTLLSHVECHILTILHSKAVSEQVFDLQLNFFAWEEREILNNEGQLFMHHDQELCACAEQG